MSVPALIALGGNVDDVRATFETALGELDATPGVTITAASRAYRTPAVGADAGGAFLNAAATAFTTLDPPALLAALQRVEDAAGRVRSVRWGPRALDLDLILYGPHRRVRRESAGGPAVTVPHPAAGWRRFVLDPACEVAADWPFPGGSTVAAVRNNLTARPLRAGVFTDDDDFYAGLATVLGRRPGVALGQWRPGVRDRRFPPNLWVKVGRPDRPPARPAEVRVPRDVDAAAAALRDVLDAAVPDPEPQPVGEPLRP